MFSEVDEEGFFKQWSCELGIDPRPMLGLILWYFSPFSGHLLRSSWDLSSPPSISISNLFPSSVLSPSFPSLLPQSWPRPLSLRVGMDSGIWAGLSTEAWEAARRLSQQIRLW